MFQKGVHRTGLLLIMLGALWIISIFIPFRIEEWDWLLRYWPFLLVVAGGGLAIYGTKAKGICTLLLIMAFLAATLHQGFRLYDINWNEYDYEKNWDVL